MSRSLKKAEKMSLAEEQAQYYRKDSGKESKRKTKSKTSHFEDDHIEDDENDEQMGFSRLAEQPSVLKNGHLQPH